MNTWLNAVEKDHSRKSLPKKIAGNRPSSIHDICNVAGQDDLGGAETCRQLAPFGEGTRSAAGGPISTDVLDCRLKPLNRGAYLPIVFSDAQWSQLQQQFPRGVCDFSQPGVGQQPTVPWQTYQDAKGDHVYGGQRLGAAPARSGTGWSSPVFGDWRSRG
jgi:hypothetical protein